MDCRIDGANRCTPPALISGQILNYWCGRFHTAMQKNVIFLLAAVGLAAPALVAQTKRPPPNSLDPGTGISENPVPAPTRKPAKYRVLAGQRSRIRQTPVRHTAQYEFYQRVERAARLRQKMLIEQSKYKRSDFGHRRPPRRRPPHKMRYCNECGIRH